MTSSTDVRNEGPDAGRDDTAALVALRAGLAGS